jgi:alanine racemase
LPVVEATRGYLIEGAMANSAAVFDLLVILDAASGTLCTVCARPPAAHPRARDLEPVLEWKTCITFLKEVPAGVGLSYGHAFRTRWPSLVATVPAGYADGLRRSLSNGMDVLVRGVRCPQVGNITMDMSLVDVTALCRVALGDEVLIGHRATRK